MTHWACPPSSAKLENFESALYMKSVSMLLILVNCSLVLLYFNQIIGEINVLSLFRKLTLQCISSVHFVNPCCKGDFGLGFKLTITSWRKWWFVRDLFVCLFVLFKYIHFAHLIPRRFLKPTVCKYPTTVNNCEKYIFFAKALPLVVTPHVWKSCKKLQWNPKQAKLVHLNLHF